MKKACLAIVFLVLLAALPAAAKSTLVASRYSDRFHVSTCKVAQKIPARDLLRFDAPEEAVASGLVPCRKCSPPVTSKPSK